MVESAPLSARERTAIREQVNRLTAHPLFSHSKRYPALLLHIVERALDGRTGDLKERTLGVEVFGREPGYDTNADPAVRITAGEIRKRLAQYYREAGHDMEVCIELAPGSYVPIFSVPATGAAFKLLNPAKIRGCPTVSTFRRLHVYGVALAAVIIILGIGVPRLWPAHTTLDRFWNPFFEGAKPVLLCIGQRPFTATLPESQSDRHNDFPRFFGPNANPAAPISLFKLYYLGSQNVALSDVIAVANLIGLLERNGKPYHIQGERSTTLSDLREGPVILVGSFSNEWTMRLMGRGRFSFERLNDIFRIRDGQNPSRRDREVDYNLPYLRLTKDFALVSRVFEPTIGRTVVVAAGLTGYGTIAASEFLADPRYLDAFAARASGNWAGKSLQIVIETKVINGNCGSPRLIDSHFW